MTNCKNCVDCDCLNGEAMNNIDPAPRLTVPAATATDDDLRALVRVAKGKPACLDCGEDHLPRPCTECYNCGRLFFLRDTRATFDDLDNLAPKAVHWCVACFEHQFDGEAEAADEKQLTFPWMNK